MSTIFPPLGASSWSYFCLDTDELFEVEKPEPPYFGSTIVEDEDRNFFAYIERVADSFRASPEERLVMDRRKWRWYRVEGLFHNQNPNGRHWMGGHY